MKRTRYYVKRTGLKTKQLDFLQNKTIVCSFKVQQTVFKGSLNTALGRISELKMDRSIIKLHFLLYFNL